MNFTSDGSIPLFKTKVSRKATKCPPLSGMAGAMETAQNVANAEGNTVAATESEKGNLAKLGPLKSRVLKPSYLGARACPISIWLAA